MNPLQPSNAESPILPFDIVKYPLNPLHPENAFEPISVTELGIVKSPIRPLHSANASRPIDVEPSIVNFPVNP